VPVPLAGRCVDGVAGVNLHDRPAARLDQSNALRDVNRLPDRV
jgi:hypothetical protein